MAVENNKEIVVDPRFFVPPGVVDVRKQNKDDGQYLYDSTTLADQNAPILATPTSVLPLPSSFSIVEQRVRTTSDGKSVVDVTLEFPDLEGVVSIEVAVSKIDN